MQYWKLHQMHCRKSVLDCKLEVSQFAKIGITHSWEAMRMAVSNSVKEKQTQI